MIMFLVCSAHVSSASAVNTLSGNDGVKVLRHALEDSRTVLVQRRWRRVLERKDMSSSPQLKNFCNLRFLLLCTKPGDEEDTKSNAQLSPMESLIVCPAVIPSKALIGPLGVNTTGFQGSTYIVIICRSEHPPSPRSSTRTY